MSGLNYLETGCLPSHNGSENESKGVFLIFLFLRSNAIFLELFQKNVAKNQFHENKDALSEEISTH
jgi:hypothetical protein